MTFVSSMQTAQVAAASRPQQAADAQAFRASFAGSTAAQSSTPSTQAQWAGWSSTETRTSVSRETTSVREAVAKAFPELSQEQIAQALPDANVRSASNLTAQAAKLQMAAQGYKMQSLQGVPNSDINKAFDRTGIALAGQYADIKAAINSTPGLTKEQRVKLLEVAAGQVAANTAKDPEIAFAKRPAVQTATLAAAAKPAESKPAAISALMSFLGMGGNTPDVASVMPQRPAANAMSLNDILNGISSRALASA